MEKYGSDRQATDDSVIRHMCTECRVNKATETHSEYAILIAFLWQQWLSERASLLRLYIHCPIVRCHQGAPRDLSARHPRHEKPGAGTSPFVTRPKRLGKITFTVTKQRFQSKLSLTFWRRNYFFILAHPVYKMWIIQEPNRFELWNKLHFEEEQKRRVYTMFKIFGTCICWINI